MTKPGSTAGNYHVCGCGCFPAASLSRRMFHSLLFIFLVGAGASANIRFLAPRPDEFVRTDEFIIVVGIPPESKKVRIFFDDKELSRLQRSSATVTIIPDDAFLSRPDLEGPHRITVRRYGDYAELIEELSAVVYLFTADTLTEEQRDILVEKGKVLSLLKPARKPLPFHNGRVVTWFEYDVFRDSGSTTGEADAWGNGGIGDIKYDYNLTLRTDEQTHYQTLQRFRGAVSYRSIARLSVGDNWPAYHQSILQQQRVRGLELNLQTPRNLVGLDVIWGQAQRSVEPFSVNESALAACTTHNDSVAAFTPGTYNRQLRALRLSFGSMRLLKASITVCRATDDTNSISQLSLIDTSINDTTITGRTPMDNLVYGADAHLSLLRGAAQLYGSFAMSWTTRDISGGPISTDRMKEYFDPDVNVPGSKAMALLLIVNESTVPFPLPVDSTDAINAASLGSAMNWDTGLRLNLPFAGSRSRLEVKYYYVGPNYASLGNQFLTVDRAGWLVNAETNLFEGKLFLKGKVNWYNKDLLEITGTPTGVVHSSVTGFLTLQHNLPTLMLLGSINNEHARTIYAADPDRENVFYTVGGTLQYAPHLGPVTPSAGLSYFNTATKLITKDLAQPFLMRSHTVVANLSASIEDVRVEPCASFSFNATTEDIPLSLISVSAGTRWHIIPKIFISDIIVGFTNTDDPQSSRRDDLFLKGSGRYEVSERHSFWADAGLKWNMNDVVDRRFKLNYELRY